jgi:hypothetical protein
VLLIIASFFAVSTNVCYHKNSGFLKTAFDTTTNFLKLPSIFTINVAQNSERKLMEKIRSLPPYKITVLEDFIDFLRRGEAHLLVESATKLSEAAFAKTWDNPEDAEYDDL